ncbi:hypothetical protein [Streptomonospora nanhaiensis]|uniref:hypothetical protein n=1 Tax=Streptomonospora nanhaiensis TaxID=1323731 RepID=UPI001C393981|nr:hypothetical protein [Streptomonospora nanhaiensis]MBV2364248.1 hypothetical protein [Streptomonospora nanhaiensis]
MPWPLELPPYDPADWWARRAAAWVAGLLPMEITRAVPELHVRPRAAGRVAWVWWQAVLAARGRDMAALSMSAVVPHGLLEGLLPDDDIALLRAIQVPMDETTPAEEIERTLGYLRTVGSRLPVRYPK